MTASPRSPLRIADMSVATSLNTVRAQVTLSREPPAGCTLHQAVFPWQGAPVVGSPGQPCAELFCGVPGRRVLAAAQASGIARWTPDCPALYVLFTELTDAGGTVIDAARTRFCFRDIRHDAAGFFLNGQKLTLRALRYRPEIPCLGSGLTEGLQRDDADILKYELGLEAVRVDGSPPGAAFLERCDEIGLLVMADDAGRAPCHSAALDAAARTFSGACGSLAFDSGGFTGVMDAFRNPRDAAFVYQSQSEPPSVGDVLAVRAAGNAVYAFTNADAVRLYADGTFIKEYRAATASAPLRHPPLCVDDFVGDRLVVEDGIPARHAPAVKRLLRALGRPGARRLPFRARLSAAWLSFRRVLPAARLRALAAKYGGLPGSSAVQYRFEAVRGGVPVRTVTLGEPGCTELRVTVGRTVLQPGDAALVRLCAVDSWGNMCAAAPGTVRVQASGAVEVLGSTELRLAEGRGGCIVRAAGGEGQGALTVTDWSGTATRIAFRVAQDGGEGLPGA